MSNGLLELWRKFGNNDSSRFIPFTFFSFQPWSKILLCSSESAYFDRLRIDGDLSYRNGKQYLVNVIYSNSSSTTFDKLGYETYMKKSINKLPPTSESIQRHLDCCFFLKTIC